MRPAFIQSSAALKERLARPMQVDVTSPQAEMPAYLESFLAHLRLLIGVPFDYLVPDSRLLPDESIRFFYIDRSWTDRLVDGAISVGKIGSREQAHHQAHSPAVVQQLDITERGVRDIQRAARTFLQVRKSPTAGPAGVITGFVLRSAAVSGWPHMDIRAYDKVMDANYDPADPAVTPHQLVTLRLERLSPGVLIALFQGIPAMVICEEPHHGVQFGVHEDNGRFSVFRRNATGLAFQNQTPIPVPARKANRRVLGIAALRRTLENPNPATPPIPPQTGAASFAIELLNPPWRQRFQGQGGRPNVTGNGAFVAGLAVAQKIQLGSVQDAVKLLVKP